MLSLGLNAASELVNIVNKLFPCVQRGHAPCRFTRIADSSAASISGGDAGGSAAINAAGSDLYGEPVTFIGRYDSVTCQPLMVRRAWLTSPGALDAHPWI